MRPRALAVSTATLIAAASLAPVSATAAGENTLYVSSASSSCSDTGSGTLAAPYCSIQAAADVANPGDVIYVEPGDYAPTTMTRSGTAAQPITITGGSGRPDIGDQPTAASDLTLSGASYVNVENLDTEESANAEISVDGGSDITLSHILSSSTTSPDALQITGGASAVTVVDSEFFRPVLINGGATGTVFTTNLSSAPVEVSGAVNTAITGNTLTACGSAVSVTNSSTGSSIENNVVQNITTTATSTSCTGVTQAYGILVDASSATGTTSDYNDLYAGNGTADYDWNGTAYADQSDFTAATGQGAHDVDGESAVDVAEGSPIINSANSSAIGEQTTDFRGDARYLDPLVAPSGAGTYDYYDRGAYQFQDPLTLVSPSLSSSATEAPVGATVDLSTSTADTWGDTDLTYTYSASQPADATLTQSSPGSGDATVSFSQPGIYAVYAYVSSPLTGTAEHYVGYYTIQVGAVTPLVAAFTASMGVQTAVEVTDNSTDDWNITKVSWDFGDSTGAIAGAPGGYTTHTYAQPGTYNITETVTDAAGNQATKTESFTTMEVPSGSLVTWSSVPVVVGEAGLLTPVATGIAKSAITVLPNSDTALAAITTSGTLELNTLVAFGSWAGWQTLTQPGVTPTSVSLAGMPNDSVQVIEVTSTGTLKHDVLNANGTWQTGGWGVPAGSTGFVQASITAMPNGDAQLVAVTGSGVLEHNIRFANGTWQGWRPLTQPGVKIANASIAGLPDGSSQIIEVTSAGVMEHNLRYANGTWQKGGWGSPAGSTGFAQASITALPTGYTFVIATTTSGALETTMRRTDGVWASWLSVDETSTGPAADADAAGTPSNTLEVSVATAG